MVGCTAQHGHQQLKIILMVELGQETPDPYLLILDLKAFFLK